MLNIKLVAEEFYCNDEPEELAVLGRMEFEVLPAERTERTKRLKPYDRQEPKRSVEKTLPEVPKRPGILPNHAYVELPPTILKHPSPVQPM